MGGHLMYHADVKYDACYFSSSRRMYLSFVDIYGERLRALDDPFWGVLEFIGNNQKGWRRLR